MKYLSWPKKNPLLSFVLAFVFVFAALFTYQSWGADDDSLSPLDQPTTSEMILVDEKATESEIIVIDVETGEKTGYGVIRWLKETGKSISDTSHDLYEKWTGDTSVDSVPSNVEDVSAPEGNDKPTEEKI